MNSEVKRKMEMLLSIQKFYIDVYPFTDKDKQKDNKHFDLLLKYLYRDKGTVKKGIRKNLETVLFRIDDFKESEKRENDLDKIFEYLLEVLNVKQSSDYTKSIFPRYFLASVICDLKYPKKPITVEEIIKKMEKQLEVFTENTKKDPIIVDSNGFNEKAKKSIENILKTCRLSEDSEPIIKCLSKYPEIVVTKVEFADILSKFYLMNYIKKNPKLGSFADNFIAIMRKDVEDDIKEYTDLLTNKNMDDYNQVLASIDDTENLKSLYHDITKIEIWQTENESRRNNSAPKMKDFEISKKLIRQKILNSACLNKGILMEKIIKLLEEEKNNSQYLARYNGKPFSIASEGYSTSTPTFEQNLQQMLEDEVFLEKYKEGFINDFSKRKESTGVLNIENPIFSEAEFLYLINLIQTSKMNNSRKEQLISKITGMMPYETNVDGFRFFCNEDILQYSTSDDTLFKNLQFITQHINKNGSGYSVISFEYPEKDDKKTKRRLIPIALSFSKESWGSDFYLHGLRIKCRKKPRFCEKGKCIKGTNCRFYGGLCHKPNQYKLSIITNMEMIEPVIKKDEVKTINGILSSITTDSLGRRMFISDRGYTNYTLTTKTINIPFRNKEKIEDMLRVFNNKFGKDVFSYDKQVLENFKNNDDIKECIISFQVPYRTLGDKNKIVLDEKFITSIRFQIYNSFLFERKYLSIEDYKWIIEQIPEKNKELDGELINQFTTVFKKKLKNDEKRFDILKKSSHKTIVEEEHINK